MKFKKFNDLCKQLELHNKKFDSENLKLLSYGQLYLAGFGNAGNAICNWELIEYEQSKRMESVKDLTFEKVETDKGKWELLDDMQMYYDWYQSKSKQIKKETTPKW